MKIKIIVGCAGGDFSFSAGEEPTVSDVLGKDLVRAKYATVLDRKAQPVAPKMPKKTNKVDKAKA